MRAHILTTSLAVLIFVPAAAFAQAGSTAVGPADNAGPGWYQSVFINQAGAGCTPDPSNPKRLLCYAPLTAIGCTLNSPIACEPESPDGTVIADACAFSVTADLWNDGLVKIVPGAQNDALCQPQNPVTLTVKNAHRYEANFTSDLTNDGNGAQNDNCWTSVTGRLLAATETANVALKDNPAQIRLDLTALWAGFGCAPPVASLEPENAN